MNRRRDIKRVVDRLSDYTRSEDPGKFPGDFHYAEKAGLYSWWADEEAGELFSRQLEAPVEELQLIYVGQAGAGKSNATLKSRILKQHIGGSPRDSTFRHTISAILFGSLKSSLLPEKPGKLKLLPEHNQWVSEWIKKHLRVAIVPWEDRDSLKCIEKEVLKEIHPPFNLKGTPRTDIQKRIKDLRARIKR